MQTNFLRTAGGLFLLYGICTILWAYHWQPYAMIWGKISIGIVLAAVAALLWLRDYPEDAAAVLCLSAGAIVGSFTELAEFLLASSKGLGILWVAAQLLILSGAYQTVRQLAKHFRHHSAT